jgi:hypothetical protein
MIKNEQQEHGAIMKNIFYAIIIMVVLLAACAEDGEDNPCYIRGSVTRNGETRQINFMYGITGMMVDGGETNHFPGLPFLPSPMIQRLEFEGYMSQSSH